jgi:hypothetical protein
MALIGSGTKVIQDFASATSLDAAAVDEGFAAVAEQLGGVYWEEGVSVRAPGNLEGANFDPAAKFSNVHKETPRSVYSLSGARLIVPADGVLLAAKGATSGPVAIVIDGVSLIDVDTPEPVLLYEPMMSVIAGQLVEVTGATLTFYFSTLHTA